MTTTARKSHCRKSPSARSKAVLVVDDSPIRAIACLKKIDDIKRFEETDDCFILGFDPSDNSPVDASSRPHTNDADDDDDLCVLGEKGKIALRDYPHSRHLCLKFPFKTTPRESYCNKCYCYVCDTAAPCMYWTMHCNAESAGHWKDQRRVRRRIY